MSKIFTVKQTAKILGFSTNTIYKYLEDGTLKSTRSGDKGRFRITQESIEGYLGSKLPTLKELTPRAPKEEVKTINIITEDPPLTLKIIRILLIATLVILILDLLLNPNTPLLTQAVRLTLVSVFILTAYQFGGFKKVGNKNE